jgi:hypothetical protein
MQKHRLFVDLTAATVQPQVHEIVELNPGEFFLKEFTGGYSPVQRATPWAGERYLGTGLHDTLADAGAAAAVELRRRAASLTALAETCERLEATNG